MLLLSSMGPWWRVSSFLYLFHTSLLAKYCDAFCCRIRSNNVKFSMNPFAKRIGCEPFCLQISFEIPEHNCMWNCIGTCLIPTQGKPKQLKINHIHVVYVENSAPIWLRSLKLITTFARTKSRVTCMLFLRVCALRVARCLCEHAAAFFGNIPCMHASVYHGKFPNHQTKLIVSNTSLTLRRSVLVS